MLYRTITMISQDALNIFVLWVSILLIAELLLDLGCLFSSIRWWFSMDRAKARVALRLGAAVTILHALRVQVFVIGRVGPWINFDVRPGHHEAHADTWTWFGIYFAAIMAVLGVIGVIIIWLLIRRAKKN